MISNFSKPLGGELANVISSFNFNGIIGLSSNPYMYSKYLGTLNSSHSAIEIRFSQNIQEHLIFISGTDTNCDDMFYVIVSDTNNTIRLNQSSIQPSNLNYTLSSNDNQLLGRTFSSLNINLVDSTNSSCDVFICPLLFDPETSYIRASTYQYTS